MKNTIIPTFGKIKLNSFRPLCTIQLGLEAIEKYKLPHFIDASYRREPDFENPFPSISALCRQGSFAPHLCKDDIIVYMTIGRQLQPYKQGHHLVAILQVQEVFATHELGGVAYSRENLPVPSNCMILENRPYDFDKTGGDFESIHSFKKYLLRSGERRLAIGRRRLKIWDENYLKKSKIWECFVKTKPLYLDVNNPTQISGSDFDYIFGRISITQTPNILTEKQFIELGKLVGHDFKLGKK